MYSVYDSTRVSFVIGLICGSCWRIMEDHEPQRRRDSELDNKGAVTKETARRIPVIPISAFREERTRPRQVGFACFFVSFVRAAEGRLRLLCVSESLCGL
jgi:hypothetical protein